jgi:hypothetical protein
MEYGLPRDRMDLIIACLGCGMDPSTDAFLINAAIAGGISGPWLLRGQLMSIARRTLRKADRNAQPAPSCPLPTAEDDNSEG